jgi:hypothetical protein
MKREVDPAWFQPQSNMNEYTQGYYQGRDYERKRILAILHDWPLNVKLDWPDIFDLINEGVEYRQVTMSPALLDDHKRFAAREERERLSVAVKAFFDRTAPAHDSDHNPAHQAIEKEIMAILDGLAD